MATTSREGRLNEAFVRLADTLTADYDIVSMLQTLITESTDILDISEGGIMLVDGGERLELIVSTSERADIVELMQLSAGAGPCLDAFHTGAPVSVPDIAARQDDWPVFSASALRHGLHAVHATPLRLRDDVIGTMNLLSASEGALSDRDAAVAQALADVATIGIMHQRLATQSAVVAAQLQRALDSRVVIEQAKGAIAQANAMSMEEAFGALRGYARRHGVPLRDTAEAIVRRELRPAALLGER